MTRYCINAVVFVAFVRQSSAELVPNLHLVGTATLVGPEAGHRSLFKAVFGPRATFVGHNRFDTIVWILHSPVLGWCP